MYNNFNEFTNPVLELTETNFENIVLDDDYANIIKNNNLINKKDSYGNTLLIIATLYKKYEVIKFLIENKININIKNIEDIILI